MRQFNLFIVSSEKKLDFVKTCGICLDAKHFDCLSIVNLPEYGMES